MARRAAETQRGERLEEASLLNLLLESAREARQFALPGVDVSEV